MREGFQPSGKDGRKTSSEVKIVVLILLFNFKPNRSLGHYDSFSLVLKHRESVHFRNAMHANPCS